MDGTPWVPIVVALAVVVVLGGVLVLGLAVVVALMWSRRGRLSPTAREDGLRELGYAPIGENRWSRKLEGAALEFREGSGWRWSIRLPRYNTLTLTVQERTDVKMTELSGSFLTGNEILDRRFAVSSSLPAQALALAQNRRVGSALLALPHVAMSLQADELVVEDVGRLGHDKLAGKQATPAQRLAAELEIHRGVAELVSAMFRTLYSSTTGTLLPEHR